MANPTFLILRLEGPLQSWGVRSRWDIRDTCSEPTKSGIVGLLGCALGYNREDKRLEDLNTKLRIGVREERKGTIMQDFQTVMGRHTLADGKIQKRTIVSPRRYLEDSAFLIVLSGPLSLLEKCKDALENPKWSIYLGRKSCPPTTPILGRLTTQYSSIEDALEKIEYIDDRNAVPPEELRCILEDPNGNLTQNDSLLMNPARMYGIRRLREYWVKCKTAQGDDN